MTTIRIENKMDTMIRDTKNFVKGFSSGFVVGVFTLATGLVLHEAKKKEKEIKEEES